MQSSIRPDCLPQPALGTTESLDLNSPHALARANGCLSRHCFRSRSHQASVALHTTSEHAQTLMNNSHSRPQLECTAMNGSPPSTKQSRTLAPSTGTRTLIAENPICLRPPKLADQTSIVDNKACGARTGRLQQPTWSSGGTLPHHLHTSWCQQSRPPQSNKSRSTTTSLSGSMLLAGRSTTTNRD